MARVIISEYKAKGLLSSYFGFKYEWDKKFNRLLIEEYIPHSKKDEKFIALERVREGIAIYYSNKGGVDIENQKNTVKKEIYSNKTITKISNFLKVNVKIL